MKMKKILSMLITVCMLLSLIPTFDVSAAAPTFTYSVYVDICNFKNAGCSKKNAIQVTFKFGDQSEYAYLTNTKKKNDTATATLTTTKPPWTLENVKLENSTKDSLWMYYIYMLMLNTAAPAALCGLWRASPELMTQERPENLLM